MKIGFLFGGQGCQYKGMGLDIFEKYSSYFDEFKSLFDLNTMFYSDSIDETINSQPAILIFELIVAKILIDKKIIPQALGGLSLGEYAALGLADVIKTNDLVELVKKRGIYMQEALENSNSGMYALIGVNEDLLKEAVNYGSSSGVVSVANYNSFKQIVITGENKALETTLSYLKEKGFSKAIKLNVTGAFHSSMLEEASLRLQKDLKAINFSKSICDLYFNYYGSHQNLDEEGYIENLTMQIKSPVKFRELVLDMYNNGIDTFVEISPKKVLEPLIKNIVPNANIYSIYNLETLNKVSEVLKNA